MTWNGYFGSSSSSSNFVVRFPQILERRMFNSVDYCYRESAIGCTVAVHMDEYSIICGFCRLEGG